VLGFTRNIYVLIKVDSLVELKPLFHEVGFTKIHYKGNNTVTGKKKLHGLSPQANYTDRATADRRRSNCQLLRTEGATWSA
jgi:hypothetical protein